MTGDQIDRTLVEPAAAQARDDRSHRLLNLAGVLVVVAVLGLAVWSWLSIHSLNADVATADSDARTATTSAQDAAGRAQQLYDQVKRLGGTPVVQPPPPIAAGPAGQPGATGATGPAGQNPPCLLTAQQCQGTDGKPGADGTQGVPGPVGPAGADGKDGQPGADGKPGADGAPGKDGADGVSVTRQYFDRDDQGACRNYSDFSDGRTRVDEGPAGDAACAPAKNPPPNTTPSAVLPAGTTIRRRYT